MNVSTPNVEISHQLKDYTEKLIDKLVVSFEDIEYTELDSPSKGKYITEGICVNMCTMKY